MMFAPNALHSMQTLTKSAARTTTATATMGGASSGVSLVYTAPEVLAAPTAAKTLAGKPALVMTHSSLCNYVSLLLTMMALVDSLSVVVHTMHGAYSSNVLVPCISLATL